ncbi:MAG: DinB family protein [Pseudomonadota bacterium]
MSLSLDDLQDEWSEMRALTTDLLAACSDTDLEFTPEGAGALWKQFRHIGGIHENYLAAIARGAMAFDPATRTYREGASRSALTGYFAELADHHAAAFADAPRGRPVDWFGKPVSLDMHLVRLISHETLHHGQLLLHWRALGHAFPASWQAWGV